MSHAKEIGTMRRGRDQDRQDKVISLCNLQGGDETEAKRQVKTLGSLGRVVAPALHAERDMLFEKYLRALDNYLKWKSDQAPVYTTNYSKRGHNKVMMHDILKRHMHEISQELQTYDQRIAAAKVTGTLHI